MTLLEALLGEHGALYAIFEHLEQALNDEITLEEIRAKEAVLRSVLISHATLEDELLFPALERAIGPDGPLAVMRMEHDRIEEALGWLAQVESVDECRKLLAETLEFTRQHFSKEEQVLFGIARSNLDADQLVDLGREWAERRGVSSPVMA